jgi:hypothetical protein
MDIGAICKTCLLYLKNDSDDLMTINLIVVKIALIRIKLIQDFQLLYLILGKQG